MILGKNGLFMSGDEALAKLHKYEAVDAAFRSEGSGGIGRPLGMAGGRRTGFVTTEDEVDKKIKAAVAARAWRDAGLTDGEGGQTLQTGFVCGGRQGGGRGFVFDEAEPERDEHGRPVLGFVRTSARNAGGAVVCGFVS